MNRSELRPEDVDVVAACRIFDGCDREETDRFLEESGIKVVSFAGREIIPHEQRSRCWGIVVSGSVRIYSGDDVGGEILLNVVGAGQPFDIASLAGCAGHPVMSEVRAAGKCCVAFIGAMDIRLIERYPKVAANVMEFFCGRIAFLNRKIHTLSRGTAERKLADWLLGEFSTDGGKPEVTVRSCSEVAVRLNLSRASLYRAIGILEQSGCISRSGKRIELLDVAALQNL